MRRKYLFVSFVAALMLLVNNPAASAQTGQLFGEVTIKQADGTTVPAAGATIDVYRVDVTGKYQTKTDKNGKFIFAGLPLVATYVIAASAPNASPNIVGDVRVGRDVNYKLTLTPGDGRRLTDAEAKALSKGSTGGTGGGESEATRKAREEALREQAKIDAENAKITNANEVVTRSFKSGNEALNAKNYDQAITLYAEGISADAAHPGIPALLTNQSVAFRTRGVERYNTGIRTKDDALLEGARKDFRDSADAAIKAVELLKAQTPPTDATALKNYESNKYFALAARAESMRLVVTKGDPSRADDGLVAFQEYVAVETDPAKKLKAQVDAAEMLRQANSWEKALAEFKKILETNPDNADALRGAGLALFSSPNKTDYQEAANFLQRFVDKAPDTHPDKASAKEALDYLKSQENIKPQKTTTTGGRRRG